MIPGNVPIEPSLGGGEKEENLPPKEDALRARAFERVPVASMVSEKVPITKKKGLFGLPWLAVLAIVLAAIFFWMLASVLLIGVR